MSFDAFTLWPLTFIGLVSFFLTLPAVGPWEVFHST